MWSLGVMLLHGDLGTAWKKALNAPFLSVVLALIVNATGLNVHIPEVVVTSIEMLGMCAIPMSILLMGAMMKDYFAECEFSVGIPFAGQASCYGWGCCLCL